MKKQASLPDTNYLLRYLLHDNEVQFSEASVFFENVRVGKITALISESVLVESIYVLVKHYKVPRIESAASMEGIFLYKGIVNPDREVFTKALRLFSESSLDIVDCILISRNAVEGYAVMTFDKAMQKKLL